MGEKLSAAKKDSHSRDDRRADRSCETRFPRGANSHHQISGLVLLVSSGILASIGPTSTLSNLFRLSTCTLKFKSSNSGIEWVFAQCPRYDRLDHFVELCTCMEQGIPSSTRKQTANGDNRSLAVSIALSRPRGFVFNVYHWTTLFDHTIAMFFVGWLKLSLVFLHSTP